MKHITIHHPKPQTHLPAHEQAARRHRAATAHLPGIPGAKPRKPKPAQRQPGRKTLDTRAVHLPTIS